MNAVKIGFVAIGIATFLQVLAAPALAASANDGASAGGTAGTSVPVEPGQIESLPRSVRSGAANIIPEPTTVLGVTMGCAAIAWYLRRRQLANSPSL